MPRIPSGESASVEGKEGSAVNPTSDTSSHIPWYLQEESTAADAPQTSSRDNIPELPDNPPAILPALVDYVFKDIGLDELKIIDSRGLETPPALGANVIMIIGTARSVKHLNVSADRLCRWLRSTYKLTPYADGLLGRNELKIKLRRKARRARLTSRSGRIFDEKDDGITTGWICVNAGVVEKAPVDSEVDYQFEGFGHTAAGTRVVVQIFTEEKREEVDLESLWQRALDRAELAKQKYPEVDSAAPSREVRPSNSINISHSDRDTGHVFRFPTSPTFEQRRQFHSNPRLINPMAEHDVTPAESSSLSKGLDHPNSGVKTNSEAYKLFDYLSDLTDEQARIELGHGPEDRESTDFLMMYYCLSGRSTEDQVVARINLMCHAVSRQHPAYTKDSLYAAFVECTSAFSVPDDLGFSVVSALLTPRLAGSETDMYAGKVADSDKELAIRVLDHLSLRGTDVLNMRVWSMIFRSSLDPPLSTVTGESSPAGPEKISAASRVSRIIQTLNIPFHSEYARHLMVTHFEHGDYDQFWKLWRKLPLDGSSRTAADYETLFRLHVVLGDETRARECVSPSIPLDGQLLQSVRDCLCIADPGIIEKAAEGSKGRLVQFWHECQNNRRAATAFPPHLSISILHLSIPPPQLPPPGDDDCHLVTIMEYLPSLQQEFDELKPSLFELLAEQQLSDLLPPSIRYLLAVATHRHPRYLLRILNSYDELYALVSLLVERYYLRTFGGSFTENFYSLKRERVLLTKNGEIPRAQLGAPGPVRETLKLRTPDVWKNLLVLVGVPYLKRKLDEGYDIHAAPHASLISSSGGPRYNPGDELPPNPSPRQRLLHYYKWFLRNVYPSINAAYYFSIIAFNLAYLFDNTKYSSPFLWLIGTRIRRLSSADHRAIAKIIDPKPPAPGPAGASARSRPGSNLLGLLSPQNIYPHIATSLRYFLPASIFALKFLEWWHASDFSRQLARKATEVLDLPAPVASGMTDPSARRKATTTTTPTDSPSAETKPKSALKGKGKGKATGNESGSGNGRIRPPISATSYLPIFTVPLPPPDSDVAASCPVCLNGLTNPTACQTGYVYCYVCIFHWLNGEHQRQLDFMDGEGAGAAWEDYDEGLEGENEDEGERGREAGAEGEQKKSRSRRGKWESGKGRCPVTGRRVLGGTEGLRRVLV
ncbi:hypothetical protein BO70DRAFT_385808 [Aspergillus heteromorphus CBS 117.55]|uniref:ATPase synthesis protein 25 n=1 Tax=Aspergillus heteromorphus CBS 117.55 TaxID=1448321 RepID=A0A317WM30_9EURO|nr:uncharacterized protein BO70DRAFT_385808 [Aspergillus heteromorphus CBS 117.55]PWY87524.1 hypothetical protein BO70DRAFT_385808 [Aspergillus heteromorphus CBS 117.55]